MYKLIKKGLKIQINFNYIIYNDAENPKNKKRRKMVFKMA